MGRQSRGVLQDPFVSSPVVMSQIVVSAAA
jgi:hypothetical protein